MAAWTDLLDERARHLLKVLIECHIRDGAPIGSRMLASESGLDISSTTVRAIMAELEELGLVASPHTSAGRIPTARGYRLFIDSLLTCDPPAQDEIERLRGLLSGDTSLQGLAVSVSALLSGVSSLAAVVMVPARERLILRHIELLRMNDEQVLAVMVIDRQDVRSTVVSTGRRFTQAELRAAANYLNATFAGRDLGEIRYTLLRELRAAQRDMDRIVYEAMRLAERALDTQKDEGGDVVVSGQTRLMEFQELSDLDRLRQLFETFDEKRKILHLLDQCMRNSSGVQVMIGEESGVDVLDECSVVTATYDTGRGGRGVIGVIGPTRMAYRRVIPLVDITARMVSAALNRSH
jgi:heat-inducible transcriptional repressor